VQVNITPLTRTRDKVQPLRRWAIFTIACLVCVRRVQRCAIIIWPAGFMHTPSLLFGLISKFLSLQLTKFDRWLACFSAPPFFMYLLPMPGMAATVSHLRILPNSRVSEFAIEVHVDAFTLLRIHSHCDEAIDTVYNRLSCFVSGACSGAPSSSRSRDSRRRWCPTCASAYRWSR